MAEIDDLGFVPDDDLGFVAEPSHLQQAGMGALKRVGESMMAPYTLTKALAEKPEEVYRRTAPWLPAAGGAIGTAFFPGVGTAAGAGLGEIARQAGGIAFGDPNVPTTPWESAKSAMTQTALAGAGEVAAVAKAAPGARPYVQRGLEAVGNKIAPAVDAGKDFVARTVQGITGVRAQNVKALIDKPLSQASGIFQMKKLGKAVEEAEEAAQSGLHPLTQAKLDLNEGGVSGKVAARAVARLKTGKPVSPREAIAGVRAIDSTMPNPTANNAQIRQRLSDARSELSDIIAKSEPKLAAAKAAYHEAKVGADFRSPFRLTKSGQTSAVPFMLSGATLTGLTMEAAKQAAIKLPLMSPALWGLGISAGSIASKVATAAVNNPTARQALISRFIVGREGQ